MQNNQHFREKNWRAKINLRLTLACGVIFVCSSLALTANSVWAGDQATAKSTSSAPLQAVFFYSSSCSLCKPLIVKIKNAETYYRGKITIEWVDMADGDRAKTLRVLAFLKKYGDPKRPPTVPLATFFIGDTVLIDAAEISKRLSPTITAALKKRGRDAPPEMALLGQDGKVLIAPYLQMGTLFWVAFADGINPCAFAAIVFLVSLLTNSQRSRREIVQVGLAYSLSIFATNFLLGFSAFSFLSRLRDIHWLSVSINCFAFLLCLVLGVLSLRDAWRRSRGGANREMLLKLPRFLLNPMHRLMREGLAARYLLLGAGAVGVAVALLESGCSWGMYFPLINSLVQHEETRRQGLLLLLWYNLIFIVPLLLVFGAVLLGVSHERLSKIGRRQFIATRVVLGVTFFAMALWIWPTLPKLLPEPPALVPAGISPDH